MRAAQPILARFVHSVTTFRGTMVRATEPFWRLLFTTPELTTGVLVLNPDLLGILVLLFRYFIHTFHNVCTVHDDNI